MCLQTARSTLTLACITRVGGVSLPKSLTLPPRYGMRVLSIVALGLLPAQLWGQQPAPLGKSLRTIDSIPGPESVSLGPDGAWYVSSFGKFDNGADGAVYRVDPDKGGREVFARGLEDPCGVVFVGNTLWAADRKGV